MSDKEYMKVMSEEQFETVKSLIRDTSSFAQQAKGHEISDLHKEILEKITSVRGELSDVKETINSHDQTLKQLTDMLPDIKNAIEAYKTSSIITKLVIGIVLGIPALAAFVGGVVYFKNLFNK